MMKMKRYTVDDILAWRPCEEYTEDVIRELFGKRKSVTIIQILCDPRLPDDDAIWVACRAMDARQQRHFACDCTESVLYLANDARCDEVVRVARLCAEGGATGAQLADARPAADAAADAYADAYADAGPSVRRIPLHSFMAESTG